MPKMPDVSSRYGAPMGRDTNMTLPITEKVTIFKVVLDSGGYDSGGAYWGTPNNVYCIVAGHFRTYHRAKTRQEVEQYVLKVQPGVMFTKEFDFYAFFQGYLSCAAWSGPMEDEAKGRTFDEDSFTVDDKKAAEKECKDFVEANLEDLANLDEEQSGHDFWLTRNHHGAGFWDRGYRAKGDRLTKSAHAWGGCDVCIGRTGKLHFQ